MRLLSICNKVIEYSFYLIFFLVPLILTSDTSELFEFNKLWVTFAMVIVIGFAWVTKMIIKREIRVQRTPLDIPILLFLASQIVSTVFSLDTHTSIWGYYSRFNGGLLSILSYIFLYYAFVTNMTEKKEDEGKPYDFNKVFFFLGGVIVFFIGILISSMFKPTQEAGIPFQLLSIIVSSVAAFFLFMKGSPNGVIKKSLYAILTSSLLVVLWGLPSHFGYDLTCLLFRGTFDVSCWTADFQPKVRIFSTLGQPAWLAAYLAALLPVLVSLFINSSLSKTTEAKNSLLKRVHKALPIFYFLAFAGFYFSLLFTQARSAILAFWVALPLMLLFYFWFYVKPNLSGKKLNLEFKFLVVILLGTGIVTFVAGQPFEQLKAFTYQGLKARFEKPVAPKTPVKETAPTPTPAPQPVGELGGTDSGIIRLIVWRGAIDIWKDNPIFGSGLETYAFSYYQHRPAAHNLTSEWKYLYNKAHNEYLNYLATTGAFGFLIYLSMIGGFLFLTVKYLFDKRRKLNQNGFLVVSLVAGYISILITNFFGFSVVMINILFYLIPAFVFIMIEKIDQNKAFILPFAKKENYDLGVGRKIAIAGAGLISIYLLYTLINFWNADRYYYYGYNYDRAQDYQKAYTFLKMAVANRPSEPTFADEQAYNNAVLGSAVIAQSQQPQQGQDPKALQQNQAIAKQLIEKAVSDTNKITTEHPNNIVFQKTKVRILYTLSQIDPTYLPQALLAIKKTAELAPTDADVSYNVGVLSGQNGDAKEAVKNLENTIKLKPDYAQAYYALGIFYHQLALDKNGKVVNEEFNQKGIDSMKYLIKNFGPNQQAQDAINTWEKK
jgi:tetratricopeptide (TPR) repeat protein